MTNFCDGVGDGHRGQAGAELECVVADGGDGVGDGHRGQAGAAGVFANYFISIICQLNGRKMSAQIP